MNDDFNQFLQKKEFLLTKCLYTLNVENYSIDELYDVGFILLYLFYQKYQSNHVHFYYTDEVIYCFLETMIIKYLKI